MVAALGSDQPGRVAQRESARFTRGRSLVRSQPRPSLYEPNRPATELRFLTLKPCVVSAVVSENDIGRDVPVIVIVVFLTSTTMLSSEASSKIPGEMKRKE